MAGATAPCWPGLRANRNHGICHDGMTTCRLQHETQRVWGECVGATLPTPGVTKGKAACKCFSAGTWAIDNTSPCFISDANMHVINAVSTYLDGQNQAACPTQSSGQPAPQPGSTWSTNKLTVDCAGHFKLCYELKAGDAANPKPTDCSMAKVCVEADYPTENAPFAFPDLPAWTSADPQCSAKFADSGGYGEMSVVGKSVQCDAVDDGAGNAYVFNRIPYCASACNTNPQAPGCAGCSQSGSGGF